MLLPRSWPQFPYLPNEENNAKILSAVVRITFKRTMQVKYTGW